MKRLLLALALTATLFGCGETAPSPAVDAGAVDAAADFDAGGVCTSNTDCADGVFCNGVERCEPGSAIADARGCVAATPIQCDPGLECDEAGRRCAPDCTNPDADNDTFPREGCQVPGNRFDCDDSDPNVHPDATEVCDLAGRDEDCDENTLGDDADSDSYISSQCCNAQSNGTIRCGTDCDDGNQSIHPNAPESCNGVNDDCDMATDEGNIGGTTFFRDADNDGFGDATMPMVVCATQAPMGYVDRAGDCNDNNRDVHPNQTRRFSQPACRGGETPTRSSCTDQNNNPVGCWRCGTRRTMTADWDYNCNNVAEPEAGRATSCGLGLGRCSWEGTSPIGLFRPEDCGLDTTYETCETDNFSCIYSQTTRGLACR